MAAKKKLTHAPTSEAWRIFRIMAEFVDGFDFLSRQSPCITLFGSAREKRGGKYYRMAEETARECVKAGFGVISGGGPGIMEAANKGATEADGTSIGLNIELPFEQRPNPFIKQLVSFQHFFCRKVMFLKYTSGVIVLPGGYGTMDEFFETLTLIQTQKTPSLPLVLMGKTFYKGLYEWLSNSMLKQDYILPEDLKLIHITDDPSEAVRIIKRFHARRKHGPNFN